jgi:hypothetical protein
MCLIARLNRTAVEGPGLHKNRRPDASNDKCTRKGSRFPHERQVGCLFCVSERYDATHTFGLTRQGLRLRLGLPMRSIITFRLGSAQDDGLGKEYLIFMEGRAPARPWTTGRSSLHRTSAQDDGHYLSRFFSPFPRSQVQFGNEGGIDGIFGMGLGGRLTFTRSE